jgi:hypothetical protein
MIKATAEIQGQRVHLKYEVLEGSLVAWWLDRDAYQGDVKYDVLTPLFDVIESMLRQHWSDSIQRDLLEHSFYSSMLNDHYDRGELIDKAEDILF